MKELLADIRSCKICKEGLPNAPNPIVSGSSQSKLLIIGQAPGRRVDETGIPWNDPSGVELRRWLDISDKDFYDSNIIGLMPMGFCYPGKGKSGDLPPRPECAPAWHDKLLNAMKDVRLILLIGQYAQKYYLKESAKATLTETVKSFQDYLPNYLPLPHPSPRNRIWMKRNAWFEEQVIPILRQRVHEFLS